jgi:hypothetical protein
MIELITNHIELIIAIPVIVLGLTYGLRHIIMNDQSQIAKVKDTIDTLKVYVSDNTTANNGMLDQLDNIIPNVNISHAIADMQEANIQSSEQMNNMLQYLQDTIIYINYQKPGLSPLILGICVGFL